VVKIPSPKHTVFNYIKRIYPGFGLCLVLGIFAWYSDINLVPKQLFIANYVLIGILLGIFVSNVFKIPYRFNDGIEFSTKTCLYIGIVLLGAGLNLQEIFSIGWAAVIMVAISITFSIVICGWIARKINAGERWGHLVGTGIGICGISAIIAMAPVIKAREKEIITAIGAVLIMDILVLITLPIIGHSLGWSDSLVGFIAGVVPANTAQCIAIGHAYSKPAGSIATIVKLARNALMPIAILIVTYIYTLRGLPTDEKVRAGLLWNKFPKFIIGFLITATLNSMGLIPSQSSSIIKDFSTWFFAITFVGIGVTIDFKELGKRDIAVVALALIMATILWLYAYCYAKFILSL